MQNLANSGVRDRAETRAAKQQERSVAGASAWYDYNAKQQVVEDNLTRQRALRLARDKALHAVADVKPRLKVRRRVA